MIKPKHTGPEYTFLNKLRAILPGVKKSTLKNIIKEAHRIACTRTDKFEFDSLIVLSVIRGNFKRIKAGVNTLPVEELFKPEIQSPKKFPILPKPDPMSVLLPNETWAGKGSAGKNNLSII